MREGDWTNGCGFSFFCFGFFFSRPRASLFPMRDSLPQLPRFCQSDSPGQSDSPERLTPWRTPRHCVLFRTRTRNRGWDLPVACKERGVQGRRVTVSCGISIGWRPRAGRACHPSQVARKFSPELHARILESNTCPANAPRSIPRGLAPLARCCAMRSTAPRRFLAFGRRCTLAS